ncbi:MULTISPECIES: DUF3103 family protein [unclassified Streptomyces]|uniref:DUF3103 family protein n=1 Tax=unclassified Streptomyces TaxID=2593676 RepID=UPI002251A228|nr:MULTISPECIES: DUF3103 family protein [unclassified Streptomyces]WSG50891.1 DUF3103 domain-containing protein [Streptomyces sp. NBC_01732]WSX01536.1 DUF3103 domain-containing protein [Streptomyces sp. NBC_00987]MCX5100779.1 DUF3103 domain-containing protein [Streptomyces sp. NBC_00439]MCX5160300.1 DUF3103 domain-containing protein [Streptomyces sp. NBC_00305]MCX5218823.1 DUF3103 domain-containing protein [Streptomyces sp. NBC_00264]
MSTSTPLRTALIGVALAATALVPLQGTALAAPSGTGTAATTASASSSVSGIEDATALALARSLADPDWSREVRRAALAADSVGLGTLADDATASAGRKLAARITAADRGVAAAKGLGSGAGSLLRLGLADASMKGRLASGAAPLVAAAPSDDDGAATFTAYDSRGAAHELPLDSATDRPVYLVDIDGAKAVAEGLKVIDKTLESKGLGLPAPSAGAGLSAASGIDTTRIDSVRLGDVEEPFFKGDAEIFTLVTGFGKDGKPRVDTVEMPYLNKEDTTYYPGQVLVNWSDYKYDMADAVMMEDDGDTDYQALAKAIAAVLLTITDQGAYIPLVDALLNAIPTNWWTDDPDYVESWYTLARSSSGQRNGAAGNGWMTVSPYHVPEL